MAPRGGCPKESLPPKGQASARRAGRGKLPRLPLAGSAPESWAGQDVPLPNTTGPWGQQSAAGTGPPVSLLPTQGGWPPAAGVTPPLSPCSATGQAHPRAVGPEPAPGPPAVSGTGQQDCGAQLTWGVGEGEPNAVGPSPCPRETCRPGPPGGRPCPGTSFLSCGDPSSGSQALGRRPGAQALGAPSDVGRG